MLNCFINSKNIETIAIGNFDGIHLGHKQLVGQLDNNSALVVIEHNKGCLTPGVKRTQYIKHPVFFYHLEKIKSFTADDFVKLLQADFRNLKNIIIGYDFVFGHQRKGDAAFLKKFYEVKVIEQFCIDGVGVHSKEIRKLLQTNFKKALKFLGRNYQVQGYAVKGQGIASKQLVPTINLQTSYCLPKAGVYMTKTMVDDCWYESISFVGHRLTTDNQLALETHIIDKLIEVKKQKVVIEFVKEIRENKKFDSLHLLKKQIENDIKKVKEYHEKG